MVVVPKRNLLLTLTVLFTAVLSWLIGSTVDELLDKYFSIQPEVMLALLVFLLLVFGVYLRRRRII